MLAPFEAAWDGLDVRISLTWDIRPAVSRLQKQGICTSSFAHPPVILYPPDSVGSDRSRRRDIVVSEIEAKEEKLETD